MQDPNCKLRQFFLCELRCAGWLALPSTILQLWDRNELRFYRPRRLLGPSRSGLPPSLSLGRMLPAWLQLRAI